MSLENLNCKFILYSVMYLIVMIGLNLLSTVIQNSSQNLKAFTKKIPLMLLINHFFLLFCGIKRIVECIKDKSKDKSKDKIINDEENSNNHNLNENIDQENNNDQPKTI